MATKVPKAKSVRITRKKAKNNVYLYVVIPSEFVKALFGKQAKEVDTEVQTLIAELTEYKGRKAIVYYLP